MCLGCRRPLIEPLAAPTFYDTKPQPPFVMAKLAQVEVEISTIVANDISHVWTVVSSHVGSAGQDQRLCGFTVHGDPLIEVRIIYDKDKFETLSRICKPKYKPAATLKYSSILPLM